VRRVSVSKTERDARDIDELMEHKDTKTLRNIHRGENFVPLCLCVQLNTYQSI